MSMDAEKTILSLPEVKGCRIFYDENGIDQIYVSASIPAQGSAGRLQYIKSLVRSVVGALALEYGWNVDYRKVKIVDHLDTELQQQWPVRQDKRIRIIAAYIKYLPGPQVRIEIELDGSTYAGVAPYDERDPISSTIEAFMEAFHLIDLGQVSLVFAHQIPASLAHSHLIIVKLRYKSNDGEEAELLGIAESRQDFLLCTVRACLSALNRKIGLYYQNGNICPAEPDPI